MRPKAARDRADPELFWLTVVVVCAVLVGLRRSSPAIRADVAAWWDRWSTVALVVSVQAASTSVAVAVLRARRRYRPRVAEAEAVAQRVATGAPVDGADPPPRHVEPFVDLPAEGGGPVLRYAVADGGEVQGWALDGPDAHCLVTGPPGSGKTNLLQVLAIEATRQGVEVVAADPRRVELIGLRNWPGVLWVATDVAQIAQLITAVHAEMERRFELIEHRSARLEPVRPGELRPVPVLLDELPLLSGRLEAEWQERRRDTDPATSSGDRSGCRAGDAGATGQGPSRRGHRPAGRRNHQSGNGWPSRSSRGVDRPVRTGPNDGVGAPRPGVCRPGHPGRATASNRFGSHQVECMRAPDLSQWSESVARLRPSRPPKPTLVPALAETDRSAPD